MTATRTNLAPGRTTINLPVPLDHVPISPGYVVTSGAARLVASEPATGGWAMTFEVTSTAAVTASVTPLRSRVAEAGGHSHLLMLAHVVTTVTVPAQATLSYTVSCADDAKGIIGTFDVPSEVVVGHIPMPKSRTFSLFNSASASATAMLDLECLSDRTTGPVDDVGVVTNTATATTTTEDLDPTDNAASARFVVDRAAGSV